MRKTCATKVVRTAIVQFFCYLLDRVGENCNGFVTILLENFYEQGGRIDHVPDNIELPRVKERVEYKPE